MGENKLHTRFLETNELKQHIYDLSLAIDKYSISKDYIALRRTHHDNIEWLQQNGLAEEYYEVLLADIKRSRENN